ncbi:galacturan 1,4-alpha-galacturonidase B [Aspergillus sergii]|uniref:Galacturan 1,4-alpha-galacturonidase B n=1 Tax=Aspergillus sergii TaxID=1034303 RepID=A0A5N6WSE8_9EURO|nr:galacturan 1,4-alpha-galacturonidase B [Aspergillus sergii]
MAWKSASGQIWQFFVILSLLLWTCAAKPTGLEKRQQCVIPANGDGTDDTPAILDAFEQCGTGGNIVFQNRTYYVNQFMRTTDLANVTIDIHGTLLWSKNTTYWLNNSQPTGYQNGSAAWFLGGRNVRVNGYGYGTLDGNGQEWYDLVKGESNYPHRPLALAIWEGQGITLTGLRMVQSQMWSLAIFWSQNVLVDNFYINSTSSSGEPARNTDGIDTINSDRVTLRNLYIRNGDDAVAIKGNSTNILIEDSTFDNSLGLAFGSVGQYLDVFERIENVTARRIQGNGTRYGSYVKTWTGEQVSYPPNGGGGGTGYIRNVTLSDFHIFETEDYPFSITQCTTFSGTSGDCDSSLFEISNITIKNWTGDVGSSYAAYMDCSEASGGCKDITITGFNVTNTTSGDIVTKYRCGDVSSTHGFTCS